MAIYGIIKVPAADMTNTPNVATSATLSCFDSWNQALAYMKADLETPDSRNALSWKLPNPKNPEQPIGLQSGYYVIKMDSALEEVQDLNAQKGELMGVPGYLGQTPYQANNWRYATHAALVGHDSAGPTTIVRAQRGEVDVEGELYSRKLMCQSKQAKLEKEMERKERTKSSESYEKSPEEHNGQDVIDHFSQELRDKGLYDYDNMLHNIFNHQFFGYDGYQGDGKIAAYISLRIVFDKVATEAVKNGDFELATNARNIVNMSEELLQQIHDEAREEQEARDFYTAEEASALLGYDISAELGVGR